MDPPMGPNNRNPENDSVPRAQSKNSDVATRDTLSSSVSNTGQKPRGRRESAISKASEEQRQETVGHHNTGTEYLNLDSCNSVLCDRLSKEIQKNEFEHNRAGFLSRRKLNEILTAERIERELKTRDAFLADKKLNSLRFSCREQNSDGKKCFRLETQEILGRPTETEQEPVGNISADTCAINKKSYIKILAILILIERPGRIKLFIDAQVNDEYLPFAKHEEGETVSLRRQSAPHEHLACFDAWSPTNIQSFEKRQWAFIVPYFKRPTEKLVPHLTFQPQMILPFKFEKELRRGGCAEVQKVTIDKEYREFNNDEEKNWCFAIKRLIKAQSSKGFREDFKREVAALRRFNGDNYKHLVSLLGTYEKDNHFHMIFSWAEGDLFEFWKRHKPPSRVNVIRRRQILRWISEQCQGLAEGLGYIHRYKTFSGKSLLHPTSMPSPGDLMVSAGSSVQGDSRHPITLAGRHGDLKPENILWYPSPGANMSKVNGILKIADFGFVEFSRKEMVNKRRRGFEAMTPTYAPPEGVLREINFVGSSYDIWSLGCIYLDFVAWWLGGWDRIDNFGQSRLQQDSNATDWEGIRYRSDIFFQKERNSEPGSSNVTITIKRSVSEFIKDSKNDSRSPRFIKDFLDLIQTYMLIVLDDHGKGRSSAAQVRDLIDEIRKKYLNVNDPEDD